MEKCHFIWTDKVPYRRGWYLTKPRLEIGKQHIYY